MEDGICADADTDLHQKDRAGRQMSRQICRCCREEKKNLGIDDLCSVYHVNR